MPDILEQKKFVKAVNISLDDEGFYFHHDYGDKFFSWDSISHVFGLIMEKNNAPSLPLFVLLPRDTHSYFYVDGNTTSFKDHKSDAFSPAPQYQSFVEKKRVKEEVLREKLKEICFHFSKTYIDKPLIGYMKGNKAFLPTFTKLRDIAEYCRKMAEQVTEKDMVGASALKIEEALPTVSISGKEREEWKEGTILEGKYTVQQILRGAMGTVYIVFDSESVKFYAMKTFQEKHVWDEMIVSRFIKEAEIWIKLGRHPNIVQAELVREVEGKHYIFLEYVQGTDLEELLNTESIDVNRAVEFGIQICGGMDYAFKTLGLIHRDIKPSNCLITRDGTLKITDFGLGKIFEDSRAEPGLVTIPQEIKDRKITSAASSTTTVMGTLAYMAPELFSDISASGVRTDIYAFGIVLYQMLAHINPFYAQDPMEVITNHLSAEPAMPDSINPDVPPGLSAITMKCLEKDPGLRFESFEQIRTELEKIYSEMTGRSYEQPVIQEHFSEEDWINKGISLASLSCHREAVLTFDRALSLNPMSLDAMIYKASSLLELERVDEAFQCLVGALKIEKKSWKVWFYCAEAYWRAGNLEESLACFDKAEELTEDKAAVLGRKGQLLTEAGKYKEALLFYNMSLGKNPRSAEIWDGKARLLIMTNRFEPALNCVKKAIEINPRMEQAWHHQGIALFNMGLFSSAIMALKTALKLNSSFADSWLYIGECYRESGDRKNALAAYRSAIKLQSCNVDAYLSILSLLKENRNYEEALTLIDSAMKINQDHAELHFLRAETLMCLGYLEECRSACKTVKTLDPSHEGCLLLARSATRWISAQEHIFEQIFAFSPLSPDFCTKDLNTLLSVFCSAEDAFAFLETQRERPRESYLKACICLIEGKDKEAQRYLLKALEDPDCAEASGVLKKLLEEGLETRSPEKKAGLLGTLFKKKERESPAIEGTPEELLLLGMRKLTLGMSRESREYFRTALNLDPSTTACLFFMGKAYQRDGENEAARTCFEQFISFFPDSAGYHREMLKANRNPEPQDREKVYLSYIGRFPALHKYWLSYLMYLSSEKQYDKVRLMASRILRDHIKAWDISDGSALFWNVKGVLEHLLERYSQAEASFAKALEFDEHDLTALSAMTVMYLSREKMDRAEEYAMQLARVENGGIISDYFLSEIYCGQDLVEKPLIAINRALGRKPESLILLYKKAHILIRQRKYPEFYEVCNKIFSVDKHSTPVKVLRALSFIENGKANDAIPELTNILSYDDLNLAALKSLGFTYLQTQNIPKALKAFETLTATYDLDYEAWLGKGMASYYAGDFPEAFESFKSAVTLNPMEPDVWQFLGALYFHLDDREESAKCWDRALHYRSGFLRAWVNKGSFLYIGKHYAQALELANRALRIDQEDVSAWILRAQCQWKLGDPGEGIKSAEKALSYSPECVKGWELRGILEFYRRNFEISLQSFEKASTLEAKQEVIWYNRALLGMFTNNQSESRKSLDRCLALNPVMFEALFMRYLIEKESEIDAAATTYFARARESDPERFSLWIAELEWNPDHLALFKPLEPPGDLFTLPLNRPLTPAEPLEALHLLSMEKCF